MDPCKSLAGVSPGQSPLQLLRSLNEGKGAKSLNEGSKIVMPFRQGPTLTTYMVDYIPPSVMPRYSGGLPCISTCFANTSGSEPRKTLQSERCDILGARVVSFGDKALVKPMKFTHSLVHFHHSAGSSCMAACPATTHRFRMWLRPGK